MPECYYYTGGITGNGYGNWPLKVRGKWKNTLAHRLIFQLFHGPIPERMLVDHKCHNRHCINPEHLRLATSAENCQHRVKRSVTSSFKGVSFSKAKRLKKCWRASIKKGEIEYQAHFDSELEAAKQYNKWAAELFGSFAVLNSVDGVAL